MKMFTSNFYAVRYWLLQGSLGPKDTLICEIQDCTAATIDLVFLLGLMHWLQGTSYIFSRWYKRVSSLTDYTRQTNTVVGQVVPIGDYYGLHEDVTSTVYDSAWRYQHL